MNILFLRGAFPKDRKNPKEILYDSLEEETDMWTHLAAGLGSGSVLYSGYNLKTWYRKDFSVEFVPKLSGYSCWFKPDVIFCRGGFDYDPILKMFPRAKTVYYGAGKAFVPTKKHAIVLVDSEDQIAKARPMAGRVELFFKPAPPTFYPRDVGKNWDCCFVAIHPGDKRKRVNWVWKHHKHSILQLGNTKKGAPRNITIKHVSKEKMPKAISRCWCVICPYTSADSNPRIIAEAHACGVPVVCLDSVRFWREKHCAVVASKSEFWEKVSRVVESEKNRRKEGDSLYPIREYYENNLTVERACAHLRGILDG